MQPNSSGGPILTPTQVFEKLDQSIEIAKTMGDLNLYDSHVVNVVEHGIKVRSYYATYFRSHPPLDVTFFIPVSNTRLSRASEKGRNKGFSYQYCTGVTRRSKGGRNDCEQGSISSPIHLSSRWRDERCTRRRRRGIYRPPQQVRRRSWTFPAGYKR